MIDDVHGSEETGSGDGFREIELDSGEENSEGEGVAVGAGDSRADSGEHDGTGVENPEQPTSGYVSGGDEDAGHQESGGLDGEQVETVETVDYSAQIDEITTRLDGVYASSVVLTFALFMCAGAVAVQTMYKSLEV